MGQIIFSPKVIGTSNPTIERFINHFNCNYCIGKEFPNDRQMNELMNFLHTSLQGVVYIGHKWIDHNLQWQYIISPSTKVDDMTLSLQLHAFVPHVKRVVLSQEDHLL